MQLTRALAESTATLALANIDREYPYKLDQLLTGDGDIMPPRTLHPVFHGCYDWHSCVHMHWTLARLLRCFPDHALADATAAHFDDRFSAAAIAGERATLTTRSHRSFERPYGWAWLLKLAAELHALAAQQPRAGRWRDAVAPLARLFAERFLEFLPRAEFATRSGMHGNSAFALILALDWCDEVGHEALAARVRERAHHWFGRDSMYPADYEPGGEDFLAAGLVEAVLMQRVTDAAAFAHWWSHFAPSPVALDRWLTVVPVADPTDPRLVHLHGVNLTRAWCWQRLWPALQPERRPAIASAIESQLAASLPAASRGDYVGTHWLASFAVLALTDRLETPVGLRSH